MKCLRPSISCLRVFVRVKAWQLCTESANIPSKCLKMRAPSPRQSLLLNPFCIFLLKLRINRNVKIDNLRFWGKLAAARSGDCAQLPGILSSKCGCQFCYQCSCSETRTKHLIQQTHGRSCTKGLIRKVIVACK